MLDEPNSALLRHATWINVVGGWACVYVGHWQGVQPWGSSAVLGLAGALPIWLLAATVLILILLANGLLRRRRLEIVLGLALAAFWMMAFAGFSFFVAHVRYAALARVAANGQPIVRAIGAFTREHGQPPRNLHDLRPRHLQAIPATGMGAYPAFEYQRDPIAVRNGAPVDAWALVVPMPFGLGFDSAIYLPGGRYPEAGWGGRVVRVGDWAYVWE